MASRSRWSSSPRSRSGSLSPGEEAASTGDGGRGRLLQRRRARGGTRLPQRPAVDDARGLGVQTGVLLLVALGRPAVVRRGLERLGRRPILGAAAAGAGVAVLIELATLPTRLVSHERAVDAGLSSQSLGPWLADVGRSAAIAIVITAAGAALLLALVRRFPRRWWLPGGGRRRRPRRPLRLDRAGRAGADIQQVRAAARGVARPRRRARAGRRGRRRDRRGLQRRRQPPGHLAQRLRRWPRIDQARRSLRQPARRRRTRASSTRSSLTSSDTSLTPTSGAASSTSRSWRRSGSCSCAS